ncbi:MAG: ABC transporter ATP-binding protein [Deltaproteobacteria bacterium]|jgi:peptide/nickel transport system ATP-binding protein|nr:ABC transporter ATP-binding protein [Deltaproteobacteria bacterium]
MLNLENVTKTFRPPASLGQEIVSLFGRRKETGAVLAVRNLSLQLKPGEILGLVGESGSGKSTLGRLMCGLYRPEAGRVIFEGRDLTTLDKREKQLLSLKIQFMFQDPASSLNPRLKARAALSEGLIIHHLGDRVQRRQTIDRLLEEVGLSPKLADRYPHQFSGGQRQRLCLARALSLNPSLLIADEPTSALDVSIQAQIIDLLLDLKAKRGLTMVLISHDLSLVCLMADRVAVMYGGQLMEVFPRRLLGQVEHHPYVKALWASADSATDDAFILDGEPPDPQNPPPGCPFHPRCPQADEICRTTIAPMKQLGPEYLGACHHLST